MGIILRLLPAVVVATACAGARMAVVTPEEIPQLERRLSERADDADLVLRYAAALYAANRCDSARVVALRGMAIRPSDALGPLVLGQCLERAEEYDQAVAVYREYLADHGGQRGADGVRAREMLALKQRANRYAREALAREAELAQLPSDPQAIAVLPVHIAADSTYQPLGRGLAQMLISDLDLLRRFRMVERLQIGALLDELQLGQTQRVDASTVARVGRLVQAGRMVQGLAVIPPEGDTRLEASVVLSDGQVVPGEASTGSFEDLLRLEKEVVVSIAQQLGYVLSEAERQLILENGTQNLAAFLAYSRGLVAEDLGDYAAAAQHFSQAVQADPGFQQARTQYQAAAVATQVQQAAPAQVTSVAQQEAPPPAPLVEPTSDAAANQTLTDLSSQQGENATAPLTQTTAGGGGGGDTGLDTNAGNPNPTQTGTGVATNVTGTVRIRFILP